MSHRAVRSLRPGDPWALEYPFAQVRRPTLLTDAGILPVAGAASPPQVLLSEWEQAVLAAGGAPLHERTWVLAIGSNGSAATLRRKLVRRGSVVVPLLPAVVVGIGAAHSAHVSLAGYVPAAPHNAPAAATRAVLGLFDTDQLAALDDSEPNYRRISVSSSQYPVSVVGGPSPVPASYEVYRSVWGVLSYEGHLVSLRPQHALHRLMSSDRDLAQVVPLSEPREAVRLLSRPRVASFVRRHWRRTGAAVADGLTR